ncbi:hypothetical protein VaNZ11_005547 [Volvox africanus]|uniref:SCD domain-containing protein n=1 Tax=Volvox africanus TaxID=51714 RepID=A0ABQ5RZG6_9CHLO|nr:hypothetical protein VaNZ11_005547 [Volvox africanus]
MAESRRRSSRILAAENKTPAKAQKPMDSSDDEPRGNGSDDGGELTADDMQKGGTLRKGNAKSPEMRKEPSPVQRAGQRGGPGAAAHKKRKVPPNPAQGEDEPVQEDENAAGAPATAGPGPSSMAAAASAKPKSAPKRGKTAPLASLHNLTLWDIITKHPASVERAAKEWVDRYCQDKLEATSELMSMIVLAGGCNSGVSVEDLDSGEMDDVIKRLVDTIVREGGMEPFRDKKLRNLRPAFEAFWRVLIADLHAAGHLLDDYVCDRLANLLIGMSSAKVRGYRHAGTLTAGLLMTGWVCAQQQLAEAISTARHQEEAAQKQKTSGADKKRMVQSLQRQAEAAQSQARQLKSLLETTFTAVFAVRFRDVGPEIRAVVVDLVGRWIGLLPATFMVDQYLKYVAWALSDRDAGVRAVAISRLLELFGSSPTARSMAPGTTRVEPPAHLPLLHGFIERFTVRFKELPYDIDEEVAILGVQLLTRLVAVGAITDAQLPASDCYSLLIDNPPAIRRAASGLAGQLLQEDATKLESSYAQRAKEAADAMVAAAANTPRAGGTRRSGRSKVAPAPAAAATASDAAVATTLLSNPEQRKKVAMLGALLGMMSLLRTGQSLTQFTTGTNATSTALMDQVLVDDIVDALYDRLPVLRSWRLIVDCMSDDLLAQLWGPTGLAHLAELLAAAVKRARSGASVTEKGGVNALRQGPRSRAMIADGGALMEASQVLINALPRLLRRHQADQNVVCPLISLIRDLKLELFSLSGDDAGWRALLTLVGEQLAMRGTVAELFTQCAETLTFAASSGPPALQPSAGMVLRDVCEQLAGGLSTAATAVRVMDEEDLVNAVGELAAGDKGADVEELLSLRTALLRAHAVLIRGGAQLAADPRVHDAVDELLADCGSGRFLGPELTGLMAASQLVVLLNNVHQMNTDPQAAAALVPGVPGPSGSNAAPVLPSMLKLQQSRDALVAHMVALHAAATAHGDAMLEPDETGRTEDARCNGAGNVAVLQDMAFRVLSDVALVFGSKAWKGTAMEPVCQLAFSNEVADLMWRHCSETLRREDTREDVDEEDNEEDEEGMDDDMTTGPHGFPAKHAGRTAAVANKMVALGCLGRLLAHGVFSDYHRTMAINLVAEFCNHGTEVADLIRDICRELAASRPHGEMPEIYTQALRQSWTAVTVAGDVGEDEEHEALQRFAELAKHIASMYAGHGTSRSELLFILQDLTAKALVDAPTNLAILAWGAASFVPKLAPADAATLVSELESRLRGEGDAAAASGAADLVHDRDDPDWAPLYHYLSLLKGKASKGRVAPRALKGASATTPKAARNRKITFVLSPKDHGNEQDGVAEAAAGKLPPGESQGRKRGRPAADTTAPEDGAWLRKAVGQVPTNVQEDEEDDEEETVKPASRQQPTCRQVANTRDMQAANVADVTPDEGNGHARAKVAAGIGAGLRAVDVDAGPLDDLAHTQSQSLSRGTFAGTSKQVSLRAISDIGAEADEARFEESDEEDGRAARGGEISDLQAITEISVKTASDDDEVEADGAEQDAAEAHADREAVDGEDEGNPVVLPTEEELPSLARRTPAPAIRPVAVASAARAAPSVSRFSLTARSDDIGSRATGEASLDRTKNGNGRESGEGEDEAEERQCAQVSRDTSGGVSLMASESHGTEVRKGGVDEPADEATTVGDGKDGEGEEDNGECEGEENEEQVGKLEAHAQRTFSTRKRRLSYADLVDDFGIEEADVDNGSGQLLPLPSISAGTQEASMRADSTVDTQGQIEPPKRRVKRRRR